MRKLTLMFVFVLFLTACAKTRAQEIPQKEKEVVIVDTTKKETQTLGDTTIKKETVAPTEVKEEEKPTVEQPKKEEVKQKEENKKTQPVQPQPKKEVKVEQKPIVKPEVPKSLQKPPVASAKPKPTPAPEKPKQIKYCSYTGSRKMVHNICDNGDPWATSPLGLDPNHRFVKRWVTWVNDGTIEKVVFKQEPERYHLIETDYLREGLKNAKDPMANCYVGGTCRGFTVDKP